jgi:hypothetical protein
MSTPTPWTAVFTHPSHIEDDELVIHWDEPKSNCTIWREYLDEEGRICKRPIAGVCFIGPLNPEALAEQKANAELIVDAVNNYERFLKALNRIHDEISDCQCDDHLNPNCCVNVPHSQYAYCIAGYSLEVRKINEESQK